jgi:hypothetical protein
LINEPKKIIEENIEISDDCPIHGLQESFTDKEFDIPLIESENMVNIIDSITLMFDDMETIRVEVIRDIYGHNLNHSKTCSV